MSSTVASEGELVRRRYYMELHNVFYQAAPIFLRKVFCEMWKVIHGSAWEEDKAHGLKLSGLKGLQAVFKNGRLQKKNVESGNCQLWDLSLLIDIITALKSENPNKALPSFDITAFTKKNLEWLKSTRNKIAHASTNEMDQLTFQPLWDDSVKVLTALGMAAEEMKCISASQEESIPAKPSANQLKAEELKNSGNQLFKNENLLEAISHYTQGIELEDISQVQLGTLYANRSSAHIEIGNFGAAKDDAKSAITLRPNWFKGYTRLGRAYEKANQFVKALFNYQLAIDFGDDSDKTVDSVEYCRMTIQKLRRCEATDPDLMRQKDLRNEGSKLITSHFLGKEQSDRFWEGSSYHLCTLARRYYFGLDGCPHDFEKAAEYFGQAAQQGNAEGLYNMGVMTEEGKGVERNVSRGHQYILEASTKPTKIEYIPGSGMKLDNIGVMESWHHLGMAYHFGVAVKQDYDKALEWYRKAIELGSGLSANNTAFIYDDAGPETFDKAVEFWKLAAHMKIVRAAENLVDAFKRAGNFKLAQEWYLYALDVGSIDIVLQRSSITHDPEIERSFDAEKFKLQLRKDVETSSLLSPFLSKLSENKNPFERMLEINAGAAEINNKVEAIRAHRQSQKEAKTLSKVSPKREIRNTTAANYMVVSSGVDLIRMEEIHFCEIKESKEDKVFTGRVLKLKVIEDAIFGFSSIYLLVEDNNGDIGRLFVYNYPQTMETHGEIGYGCQFYLINPHYRSMRDRKRGLRVDDPQLIFKQPHLRIQNRCRYCGDAEGNKVACRKCRRVTYCSKLCLKRDAEEREHSLVCVKHL